MDDIIKTVRAMADLNKAGAVRVRVPVEAETPHSITIATQTAVDPNEMLAAWQKAAELDGNPCPPVAAEIQVTPEMVAAGMKAFQFASPSNSLVGVYRAMHALAPVELVSAGELAAWRERDHWAKECTRAVGIAEERGHALLHILGDTPMPYEDHYERCRRTAANALGYQDPDPMELAAREVPTYYDIGWDERRLVTQGIVDNMERAILKLSEERDEIRKAKDIEIGMLRQALAMKDARIAQLDTRLASTPVAFEDPDATPEPERNPFRDFGHDPRRMGP